MPSAPAAASLHPPKRGASSADGAPALENPLPPLLHTPSGLALLELQGTINTGEDGGEDASSSSPSPSALTRVGRLDFPEYEPGRSEDGGAWMKRVYLYVGANQRLTGEIKKLPRPVAVIRRRSGAEDENEEDKEGGDALEVVEIVRYKLVFSQRPEPIGAQAGPSIPA